MNREIKLRAWCEDGNDYMMCHYKINHCDNGIWFDMIEDFHSSDVIQVMQFTGLYDKHGKEIYEGDVIEFVGGTCNFLDLNHYGQKHCIGKILVVKKLDSGYTLMPKELYVPINNLSNLVGNINNYTFWNHQKSFIIIGNIHQNPELLK